MSGKESPTPKAIYTQIYRYSETIWQDSKESDVFTFFKGRKEWETSNLRSLSHYILFSCETLPKNEGNNFSHFLICLFLTECFATWTSSSSDFSSLGRYYEFLPPKALMIIITLPLGLFQSQWSVSKSGFSFASRFLHFSAPFSEEEASVILSLCVHLCTYPWKNLNSEASFYQT